MGAKKLASYGATLAQGVPLLGGVLGAMDSIIDSLYNAFKEHKLYNKVNSINKVIQSKFGTEEDISLEVAKVAFAITYIKENEILNYNLPEPETAGSFYKAANALKNALDQMTQSILPSVELHNKNSNGAMLALKDVIAFFVYIAKNADFISSDSRSIEEQMKSIIEHGSLDKLISQASDKICNSPEIEEIADDVELTTPPLSPILTESNYIKDIEPVKIAGKESPCCCIII